jgi:hypothetical protein
LWSISDQNSGWAFACSVREDPPHHQHSVKRFGHVLQTIHAALDQRRGESSSTA